MSSVKRLCRATATRSFDGEASSSYYATGFVVDAARGLILTNRHVVTPGTQHIRGLCTSLRMSKDFPG